MFRSRRFQEVVRTVQVGRVKAYTHARTHAHTHARTHARGQTQQVAIIGTHCPLLTRNNVHARRSHITP